MNTYEYVFIDVFHLIHLISSVIHKTFLCILVRGGIHQWSK